ncbi:MAG: flagellar hook-length control protein FliK [Chromatiaceae bacterium]|nr:flagellar hook-length control protein FliK [Chromatiaceae bacterium]
MNQINLDNLFRLSAGGKADSGTVKLVLAQVYQAQLQQLPDGGARLQLGAGKAPLQLTLSTAEAARLQPLLQPAAMPDRQPASSAGLQLPVQVQFTLTADNQIRLNLQHSQTTQTLALSAAQVRQLLLQFFQSTIGASPVQTSGANSTQAETAQQSAVLVSARLPVAALSSTTGSAVAPLKAGSIQLPMLAPLSIAKETQQQLNPLLQNSQSNQLTVLLQLNSSNSEVGARLLLPGNSSGTPLSLLDKPQQQQLLQQLVQLFNQQRPGTLNQLPLLSTLALPPGSTHQVQLQQQGSNWQLVLQTASVKANLSVDAGQFNRPLQLVGPPAVATNNTVTSTAQLSSTALSQAWRHLMPVLPSSIDPLASLQDLAEPVQQLLQTIRLSQLDGAKVANTQQLLPQLLSLLQFQPLQSQPSLQTSGGTLAVAIQLLLGHLLQKPVPAAQTPANQRLSQLVSTLEPQQASNLLRQLASHSSTLQQSQLATLDSSTQAQQLILQLPLNQGGQSVFSQLQIEQREADGKQDGSKRTMWQLTMRFNLQQLGAMLVIARLQQQQLQLQFYTEQPQALALTEQFLPILKDRCKMQGLDVHQAECVLGKIPESLLPRANSLLAIKV